MVPLTSTDFVVALVMLNFKKRTTDYRDLVQIIIGKTVAGMPQMYWSPNWMFCTLVQELLVSQPADDSADIIYR